MAEVKHLGPRLRLDEPTLSYDWIRFDAPGDFQLILRDDFFAIDGFDEEMLLGWHVDSNLSRRMFLHRGSIESSATSVAGYHCNHNRLPTVYHGAERSRTTSIGSSIPSRAPRSQRNVRRGASPTPRSRRCRSNGRSARRSPTRCSPRSRPRAVLAPPSDAVQAASGQYDSGHVLPFIADSLVVSPLTTIGYIGINPILDGCSRRWSKNWGPAAT